MEVSNVKPQMRVGSRIGRSVLAGLVLLLPACSGLGSGRSAAGAVELAFKGRCVDARGRGISAFSLSVERSPSKTQLSSVNVTTKNGRYEARAPIREAVSATGRALGSPNERVVIEVSADGYQSKRFTVTADRLLLGRVNTLDVTLEPAS